MCWKTNSNFLGPLAKKVKLKTLVNRKKLNSASSVQVYVSEMAALVKADAPSQRQFTCDLEVDFGCEENASIVYAALAVDKELHPDKVTQLMKVSNGKLSVHFEAIEARFLRASFSAFLDVLTLATNTIEEFGQGMEL